MTKLELFKIYDKENPAMWDLFKKFAFEAKYKGFKTYGSKGIIELIRWHTFEAGNDGYKINNNHAPYYADKMITEFPEFNGFFRRRERKSGSVPGVEFKPIANYPKLSICREPEIG